MMTPATSQIASALATALQFEKPPKPIIPPSIPSAQELLERAGNGNHILEWLIVEAILRTVAQVFPHFSEAKRLYEWTQPHISTNRLRNPPSVGCVLLDTPALELKHPELPRSRTHLLIPGLPAQAGGVGRETYCVVILDHTRLAQAQKDNQLVEFNSVHVSTLATGTLLAPAICRLIFETTYKAAMFTEAQISYRVFMALFGMEYELKQLWALLGLTW